MKFSRVCISIAALTFAGIAAAADVTYSNVNITGSLSGGTTFNTGSGNDIDFTFNNALVGDGQTARTGNLVITYEAKSNQNMVMDDVTIGILGALSGSGQVFFNELVEDVATGRYIAKHNAMLTNNNQLPYTHTVNFDSLSRHIKVKKSFTLSALDTNAMDLSQVNLLEQRIGVVPEPATMGVLGVGLLAMLRKRRSKKATA